MTRRQDEQEDLWQTVVGLAVRGQDVRLGNIWMYGVKQVWLTFSPNSLNTMIPRSSEYCLGSIS